MANLSEQSVTDFYDNIEKQKINQIKKYMGYHDIITGKNKNNKYIRSCKKYQAIISDLAQFYNLYYDLYLSYKHGLRIAPLGSKNGKYIVGITNKGLDNYTYETYEIGILQGINRSVIVCDTIKDIFDKLYIPFIRKYVCEFVDIKKEALDLEAHITRKIKAEGNLIPHPTYHSSTSYIHPWWNFKNSSLEPFY